MPRPADAGGPQTGDDDPRVGRLLGRRLLADDLPRAVILGFPSDEGVRRNGGRSGAAGGPSAIRTALYRLTPDPRDDRMAGLLERTRDLGDVEVTGDVEADQRTLGEALAPFLSRGIFAVVLGGGHETAYGHFLGYVEAGRPVRLVSWDAHADVRSLKEGLGHSGSPFRQAIEHRSGACLGYSVAGLQPQSVSAAHAAFVRAHGRLVWREEVNAGTAVELYRDGGNALLVSFDLDAVDQSEAPGVSAPAAGGLPGSLWLAAAEAAGANPSVRSADLVELNPAHDPDDRTARLAALTVWRLLRGVASRH